MKLSITHDDFLRDYSMVTSGNFAVAANANRNKSLLMDLRQLRNFPHLIPPDDEGTCLPSCNCSDQGRKNSPDTIEDGSCGRAHSWYHGMTARGIVELPRAGDGLNSGSEDSWWERGEEDFECLVALVSELVATGYRNGAVVLQSVKSSVKMKPASNAGLVSCLSVELPEDEEP
jgi:hypothetical protein